MNVGDGCDMEMNMLDECQSVPPPPKLLEYEMQRKEYKVDMLSMHLVLERPHKTAGLCSRKAAYQ